MQDHVQHGLHMGHADGLGAFGLARVNGDDAAPDGLGHISAGVDGNHQNGGGPDVVKPLGTVCEIGKTVVEEHRLQHHGGAPEDLHIDADNGPNQLQEKLLHRGIAGGTGNGVQHTAQKADDAANGRCRQGEDQGVAHTGQIGSTIFGPELANIIDKLNQNFHESNLLLFFIGTQALRTGFPVRNAKFSYSLRG